MRKHFWKPTLLTLTALAMTGLSPALVSAQDRPDEHRQDEHRQDEQRPNDHQVMKADIHRDDHRNDDPVSRYRHDHPHSSARCHDGFFTSTKDRSHACTKHGGIDVWLSL